MKTGLSRMDCVVLHVYNDWLTQIAREDSDQLTDYHIRVPHWDWLNPLSSQTKDYLKIYKDLDHHICLTKFVKFSLYMISLKFYKISNRLE